MKNHAAELKQVTEQYLGKNTVQDVHAITFLMVKVENEYQAKQVFDVWKKMENCDVDLDGCRVFAFPKKKNK